MLYFNEAIAACEQALQSQIDFAAACRTLGSVLQAMGKFEEALHWHTRAIVPQPAATDYMQLGNLYATQQQWPQAIATYQSALRLEPGQAMACLRLADALAKAGRGSEALEFWYQGLALKPHLATAEEHFNLGDLFAQHGIPQRAVACYTQALCQNPNHAFAHYHLAEALVIQNRWQEAIEHYRRAIECDPQFMPPRSRFADLLLQQGYWDEAIDLAKSTLALQQGKGSEALEFWYQGLALKPHLATAEEHFNLGDLFAQHGIRPRAIACYTQALRQNPNYAFAHYHLAEALVIENRWQEAIVHYRHAIECDPQFMPPRSRFADLLLQQGHWDEAIDLAKSTLALQQETPWAHSHLERALVGKKQLDEAIAIHQQNAAARGWQRCIKQDYQFTRDRFTHHIPIWNIYLRPFADVPEVAALEIGSFEGMATCWLLDQILTQPSARITCIDSHFLDLFDRNIAKTTAVQKVTKRSGSSDEVLPLLPTNSYSMVYINGWPTADQLYTDQLRTNGRLAWNLLKTNGLMIVDNDQQSDRQPANPAPKQEIDAFLAEIQGEAEILHQALQVIIKKTVQNVQKTSA